MFEALQRALRENTEATRQNTYATLHHARVTQANTRAVIALARVIIREGEVNADHVEFGPLQIIDKP